MSATGLEVFDKTIHETNAFLKIVMRELETDDRKVAFGALRGTLHALRDNLGVAEMAHLSAQLPMLLRGLFYEGWVPASNPARERRLDDFLDHVAQELPPQLERYPEESVRASFVALSERVEVGELTKLIGHLARDLRGLWPQMDDMKH
jgi:uncharacterized protein (DUF2267 family)